MTPNERVPQREQPVINIIGELVALGPLARDLLPFYQKWANDFEVSTTAGDIYPATRDAAAAWYERKNASLQQGVTFTIYEGATLRPIGFTELRHIDHHHGTAMFVILIGEKDCWGKGYGAETARLMLDYGFTALGLHNILLTVFAYNARGIRAYTRAGFREIGRRREARRVGSRAYDVIYMECLASEFQSPVLRRLLPTES